MPWVKIDDQFPEHPKVARAGPLALAMQVAALCYCNRKMTDGFIPRGIARTLLDWEILRTDGSVYKVAVTCGMSGEDVTADLVIGLLTEVGIWEQVPGGYMVHDYLEYQPSKADIEAKRAQASAAGRKGGKARSSGGGSETLSETLSETSSGPLSVVSSEIQANRQAKSKPKPVPKEISHSLVINHQVSRAGEDASLTLGGDGDSSPKPQVTAYDCGRPSPVNGRLPDGDPVAERWLGLFKPSMRADAAAALRACRRHFDDSFTDRVIGDGIAAAKRPTRPRWLLVTAVDQASQRPDEFPNIDEIRADLDGREAAS